MCCRVMTFTFDAQVAKQTRNISQDTPPPPKKTLKYREKTPPVFQAWVDVIYSEM